MRNHKGFTLIEVVVVTLVIAALALLVAPSFRNSTVTNDIERAKMGLTEYTNAVKLYLEAHPLGNVTGWLDLQKFTRLTDTTVDGYAIWPNTAGRWGPGPVSANFYTLVGLDCKFGYGVGGANVLSKVMCNFDKYNGEGKECYWFVIEKANPVLIKKYVGGSCDVA